MLAALRELSWGSGWLPMLSLNRQPYDLAARIAVAPAVLLLVALELQTSCLQSRTDPVQRPASATDLSRPDFGRSPRPSSKPSFSSKTGRFSTIGIRTSTRPPHGISRHTHYNFYI